MTERVAGAQSLIRPPDDGDVWLKSTTAALVLGFSPQYLGRLAAQERIPAVRRGPHWWFRRRDVEQQAAARAFCVRVEQIERQAA